MWLLRICTGADNSAEHSRSRGLAHTKGNAHAKAADAYAEALSYHQLCDLAAAAEDAFDLARSKYSLGEYLASLHAVEVGWSLADRTDSSAMKKRARKEMFRVLYELGDHRSAAQILDDAESLIEKEDLRERAWLASYRATLAEEGGKLRIARRGYAKALNLSERAKGTSRSYGITINLIRAHIALGEIDDAKVFLDRLNKRYGAWPDNARAPALTHARATYALARGRPQAAARLLDEALERGPSPEWSRLIQLLRGRALEALGRDEAAAAAYRGAVEDIENIRRFAGVDDFKAGALSRRREAFEYLFRLELKTKGARGALGVVERLNGRVFLDAFARSSAIYIPAADRFRAEASRTRTHELLQLFPMLSRSPSAPQVAVDTLLTRLRADQALVYFRAGDSIWLMSVRDGRVASHELKPSAVEISKLVARFRAKPHDRTVAAALGAALVPAGVLPNRATVHIVPDDVLNGVPFAALVLDGRRLVERYNIALVPSLSALVAARARTVAPYGEPLVLAFGPRLAHDQPEADWVADHLDTKPVLGSKATSEALRRFARARVLHIAGHSQMGRQRPWLELADGPLRPSTIMALQLSPRLAVLSSCASAQSWGDQLWGSLGAATLAAGARSVVATLWSIDDRAARAFMVSFYQHGGAEEPVTALALAQREWIGRDGDAETWAAFIHLGPSD